MRLEKIICDRCKIQEISKDQSIPLKGKRYTDSAGDSDTYYHDLDLCGSCAIDILRSIGKDPLVSQYILREVQGEG